MSEWIAFAAVALLAGVAETQRSGSAAMAPGYRSWKWTKQDWRSVVPSDDGIDWSKKCGASGTKTNDGRPALCLPVAIIESLNQTNEGRRILLEQAVRKWNAREGERVPWHPRIRMLHRDLEKKLPNDIPRK